MVKVIGEPLKSEQFARITQAIQVYRKLTARKANYNPEAEKPKEVADVTALATGLMPKSTTVKLTETYRTRKGTAKN